MSEKKEMRIALENYSDLTLSEGNEVARTYTELSENLENITVALYLRYVYEDFGASDVLIDVADPYFRLYIDKKLVFEQTSSTISVIDGDMVIDDTRTLFFRTLFFRHFADNGLIFKLELNEGWSLSVEHRDHTIEQPESLLEQALAEWAVN